MTTRAFLTAFAALALAACAGGASRNADEVQGRYQAETARLLCDSAGLASERSAAMQTLDQTADDLAGTTDVTRETSSILQSKLIAFEAEVEGAHRNVVMACQLYARCMEANDNEEGACTNAEGRWDAASYGFQDLTLAIRQLSTEVQLAQVEAQVAVTRAEQRAAAARARAAAAAANADLPRRCPDRCRRVANVFTAGCSC